jgi:hypothetical protein
MMVTLSHLYPNSATAHLVVDDLMAAGLPEDDIGIISSTHTDPMVNAGSENADDVVDRDGDGADDRIEGAEKGATIGGAAGLLAGLGAMLVPGLGPVVAAGWVTAALAGVVAGGVTGGVVGELVAAGISDNDAAEYAEGVRRGGTLITIRVMGRDRADYERILNANGLARDRSGVDPAGIAIPPLPPGA